MLDVVRARTSACEALGEGVDVDAALGLIAAPGVDADRAGLDVVVADDEDVRELLQLGLADPRAERLLGLAEDGPEAVALQPVDDAGGVGVVVAAHREHPDLLRGQPGRERAGVVLHEHAEEPLDRAEQRAVDHDRLVALVVGADVLDAEALGRLEVELDGGHLPGAADGVAGLHRDLRAVEGAAALVEHELEVLGRRPRCRRASVASSHSSSVPTALPGGLVDSSR